jgi:hypothetical protein
LRPIHNSPPRFGLSGLSGLLWTLQAKDAKLYIK